MRIPTSTSTPTRTHDAASRPRLVPLGQTPPAEAGRRSAGSSRAAAAAAREVAAEPHRFSVLNDFRYLTDSDKSMLGAVTGEKIEPGFTDKPGASSAFALQLALDRRTGALAPSQPVTSVYLKNASADLDRANAGRQGFTNPYSGDIFNKAVSWLDANGRGRADILA